MLRAVSDDRRVEWDSVLSAVLFAYDRFTNERPFQVNDLVWLRVPQRASKLLPRYCGPYIILNVMPNGVNYRIRLARTVWFSRFL